MNGDPAMTPGSANQCKLLNMSLVHEVPRTVAVTLWQTPPHGLYYGKHACDQPLVPKTAPLAWKHTCTRPENNVTEACCQCCSQLVPLSHQDIPY